MLKYDELKESKVQELRETSRTIWFLCGAISIRKSAVENSSIRRQVCHTQIKFHSHRSGICDIYSVPVPLYRKTTRHFFLPLGNIKVSYAV